MPKDRKQRKQARWEEGGYYAERDRIRRELPPDQWPGALAKFEREYKHREPRREEAEMDKLAELATAAGWERTDFPMPFGPYCEQELLNAHDLLLLCSVDLTVSRADRKLCNQMSTRIRDRVIHYALPLGFEGKSAWTLEQRKQYADELEAKRTAPAEDLIASTRTLFVVLMIGAALQPERKQRPKKDSKARRQKTWRRTYRHWKVLCDLARYAEMQLNDLGREQLQNQSLQDSTPVGRARTRPVRAAIALVEGDGGDAESKSEEEEERRSRKTAETIARAVVGGERSRGRVVRVRRRKA